MKISMTLSEVLHKCNDWDKFCEEFGWSVYACNEGGDRIEVQLTEEEARRHGIIS